MEVVVTAEAQEQFDRLPRVVKVRVVEIYERLRNWPAVSGAKPLRHNLKGQFRIRTGDWRIVFIVKDQTVRIIDIDHRKDIYQD